MDVSYTIRYERILGHTNSLPESNVCINDICDDVAEIGSLYDTLDEIASYYKALHKPLLESVKDKIKAQLRYAIMVAIAKILSPHKHEYVINVAKAHNVVYKYTVNIENDTMTLIIWSLKDIIKLIKLIKFIYDTDIWNMEAKYKQLMAYFVVLYDYAMTTVS